MITVWKDGTYKEWDELSAEYAGSDPEWLVNIPSTDEERKRRIDMSAG